MMLRRMSLRRRSSVTVVKSLSAPALNQFLIVPIVQGGVIERIRDTVGNHIAALGCIGASAAE